MSAVNHHPQAGWTAQEGDLVSYNTLTGFKTGIVLKVVHTPQDLLDTPLQNAKLKLNGSQKAYFITGPDGGGPDFVAGIPLLVVSKAADGFFHEDQ